MRIVFKILCMGYDQKLKFNFSKNQQKNSAEKHDVLPGLQKF